MNFPYFPGDEVGNRSGYSGKGPLVDGRLGVDITAPGHFTFSTATGNAYEFFSGTSSAAPHVVGAAALLLQYDMTIDNTKFKQIIYSTATVDKYTGAVPNNMWGYGKLNIEGALKKYINGL